MPNKNWIPLTGELVLRTLDENSGLSFSELERKMGLTFVGPGMMALMGSLIQLAEAGLVALEGLTAEGTRELYSTGDYSFYHGDMRKWHTTPAWMQITNAISNVWLGSQRQIETSPLLCYPVFGIPGSYLEHADIFVLMPFSTRLRPVYDDHLRPVAERLKLSIRRADDFYTSSAIMKDVWSAINASSLIIADCTGRNPNVFYELGVAHTLGVPVMMISQASEDIPSDLRHLRYYVYEFTPRGMKELEDAVSKVVETTLLGRY